jgi:hypothetical protein
MGVANQMIRAEGMLSFGGSEVRTVTCGNQGSGRQLSAPFSVQIYGVRRRCNQSPVVDIAADFARHAAGKCCSRCARKPVQGCVMMVCSVIVSCERCLQFLLVHPGE